MLLLADKFMVLCYAVEIMNALAYLIRFDGGAVMCPGKVDTLPQWLERGHTTRAHA